MSDQRFYQIMNEAWDLPPGPVRLAMLEEAVREADTLGDLELGWEARNEVVETGVWSGFVEKSIVAYGWLLAQYDQAGDELDREEVAYDLMWQYKWIIDNSYDFPQITREQIDRMLDDMQARYRDAGYNMRPVNYLRMSITMQMGYMSEARELADKWRDTSRDDMADCNACETNNLAELHFRLKDYKQGLQTAKPILDGRQRCAEIPHKTYPKVLLPLLHLGEVEKAHEYQKQGWRKVARKREFLKAIGEHLLFLVCCDEFTRARKIFVEHYGMSLEASSLESRFWFQLAGLLLLEKLVANNKHKTPLRLPQHVVDKFGENENLFDAVLERLRHDVADLADQFNRRNGTDYYSQHIAEARQLATVQHA